MLRGAFISFLEREMAPEGQDSERRGGNDQLGEGEPGQREERDQFGRFRQGCRPDGIEKDPSAGEKIGYLKGCLVIQGDELWRRINDLGRDVRFFRQRKRREL